MSELRRRGLAAAVNASVPKTLGVAVVDERAFERPMSG
jgi:hypothetical protein